MAITGGTRGIGRAIAEAFVRDGASVVMSGRDAEKGQRALDEMAAGDKVHFVQGDAMEKAACEGLVSETVARYGRIDILVNNAGCNIRKPALEVTWEDWNTILDTNLRGPFFVAQAVARHMTGQGGGRIINIGSVTSVAGYAGLGPYGASRGGIKQLTMSLAADWGPHGVTVNCLAPGWFKTSQNAVMYEDADWVRYLSDRIPLRRPGAIEDLDGALVFLASEAGRYVTGQTLLVDGGITVNDTRALPARKK